MRNEMPPRLQKVSRKVSESMRELAADASKSITAVGGMDLGAAGAATGRGFQKAKEGMQKELKGVATKFNTKIGALGSSISAREAVNLLGSSISSIKGQAQERARALLTLQESIVVGGHTIRVQQLIAEGGFSLVFLVKVS
jgi:hypothetical protein